MKATLLVKGKHHRLDHLSLDPRTIRCIKRYLRACKGKKAGPLFTPENQPGQRLDPRTIRKAFRKYFDTAGVRPDRTAHSLRHTAATLLIEGGVPIAEVARRMRHSDLITTLRTYYHDEETLRAGKGATSVIDIEIP